jgi:hypothetical protein
MRPEEGTATVAAAAAATTAVVQIGQALAMSALFAKVTFMGWPSIAYGARHSMIQVAIKLRCRQHIITYAQWHCALACRCEVMGDHGL